MTAVRGARPARVQTTYEHVYAPTRAAWRRWLAKHAASSPGIWLVFDKKGARERRLPYADAVEEALCFGWIDSVVHPIDDARYEQLFTPRKAKSTWSRVNKERVARLLEQRLIAPAGLASIDAAKANGTWTSLDHVESMTIPDDLASELARDATAARHFHGFPASARKAYLHWLSSAKRPETRERRLREVMRCAANNQKFRGIPT